MWLIELAGPSGVGKSTVYAELMKLGGFTPNPKPSFEEAIHIVDGSPDEDIQVFADLIDRFFNTAQGDRLDVRYSFAKRTLAKTVLARMENGPPMVVDGGLVHRGLSALSRLTSQVSMAEYYAKLPAPDLICMFTAPKDVLEERNKSRGHDDRSHEVVLSLCSQVDALAELAKRQLNLVMVDAMLPPAENAKRILHACQPQYA